MTEKGYHPLAEIISRCLFGIEYDVSFDNMRVMVSNACREAVEYHEAALQSYTNEGNTKNFDIIKWAKEERLALQKDGNNKYKYDNSKYIARYIDRILLPQLEEVFPVSTDSESVPFCYHDNCTDCVLDCPFGVTI